MNGMRVAFFVCALDVLEWKGDFLLTIEILFRIIKM